ncbi:protein kinase domain-containing protein [Anatilimnocola aggregata]|uniref:protein kinase domain-containing protein n=1 Tax=Anatilimnocola aggregata TaxID=2528021 RepID=UPI00192E3EAD|nr:protein kinase [Anatilimnocola aggregata]
MTVQDIGSATLEFDSPAQEPPAVGSGTVVPDSPEIAATYDSTEIAAKNDSAEIAATYDSTEIAAKHDSAEIAAKHDSAEIAATYDSTEIAATYDSSVILPLERPEGTTGKAKGGKPPAAIDPTNTGMTIQAGRFTPNPEEMNDVEEIFKTIDVSDSGSGSGLIGGAGKTTPLNRNDLTAMWDSSQDFSVQPGAPLSHTAVSPPGSSIVPLSHTAISPPSGSRAASGSGAPPGGSGARKSSHSGGSGSESLENSLVIQPRVLRNEGDGQSELVERIDYNLLRKLGEGGMGIVYAARQSSIRRTVALKMLKGSGVKQSAQREKFLAEAVITGDLEHPNIVPIYDLGRDEEGAIFYAMKHVKGTPWDKLLPQKSTAENLEILLKTADGVAFAHSRGVLHRDLKPENVMIGEFGEVLVMDWGLALSMINPPANVALGGTPAYMAPEMTFGPVQLINATSDVYLLGAILFEIVTGKRPHGGPTVTRCLMSAAKNEIITTDKSGELVDIARKAMATRQEDRYPGVREFQAALREYQSHSESIALSVRALDDLAEARRTDNYETYARALFAFQEAFTLWAGNSRAQVGVTDATQAYAQCAFRKGDYDLGLSLLDAKDSRFADLREQLSQARQERDSRQRRLRTARRIGAGLAAAMLLIVTGAFFWIRAEAQRARAAEVVARNERAEAVKQKQTAEEERARAESARAEEEQQRKIAEQQRMEAVAARQQEKLQREAAETQRAIAVAAQREEEQQRRIADEQKAAAVLARQEEQKQRQVAEQARVKEEYEAYVARLGLASSKIQENAFDHALALLKECPPQLRNWEWGRLYYLCTRDERTLEAGVPMETLDISPNGQQLVVGGWGGEIRILNINSEDAPVKINTGAAEVFAVAFSPDGKTIAAGTSAKPEYVSLWDAQSGQRRGGLQGHADAVISVRFSRSGESLLTGSYDNTARLWNLADRTSRTFRGHDWWVWSAEFSPDEKQIVTASQDGSAIVWTLATGKASPPFLGHTGPVFAASFAPDGRTIASASYDKRILLWDPTQLREVDLERVLGSDRTGPGVKEDTSAATPFVALTGHSAAVRSVQFSADGKMLVSAGNDNVVCLWDVPDHKLVKKFRGHASRVAIARFAPGGDRIASAGLDRFVKLWRISQYEEMKILGGRVLHGHRDSILGAAFSPDGNTVVTASRDKTASAWNAATGERLRTYDEGHQYLASAAWCFPDGKRVLTAAADNSSRIWDVATGAQQAVLVGTGPHAAVALAPSGDFIVSGSDDRSLRIWSPAGKLLREFAGLASEITAIAVSQDEARILTGDAVGRVRLLSAADGKTLWENRSHSRAVTSAAFLGTGDTAVTASLDHTVAVWNVATGKEDAARLLRHPAAVTSLAVSSDGGTALTACADKQVRQWNLATGSLVRTLPVDDIAVTGVAITPDGKRALTATAQNQVRLWNLADGTELVVPGMGKGPFLDLAATTLLAWSATFSPTGDRVLTAGGAEAHLWDAADSKLLVAFSPQSAVSSVQFSPSGDELVTGSWDKAARVWNSATGATLLKLGGVHTRFVNASAFSPDGTQVITASDDQTACLWDATTGRQLQSLVGHTGSVTDVAFSRDGKQALTASADKTARIWDVRTGKTLHVLTGHTQAVLRAAFSVDGRRVLTGSDDTTARLWNAETGEYLGVTLAGHTASVTAAAFSRDGSRVFTGSKDMTVKVWDPATGKEVLTLPGHAQEVTVATASPDGRRLLTASRDGTAILWDSLPWQEPAVVPQPAPPPR